MLMKIPFCIIRAYFRVFLGDFDKMPNLHYSKLIVCDHARFVKAFSLKTPRVCKKNALFTLLIKSLKKEKFALDNHACGVL